MRAAALVVLAAALAGCFQMSSVLTIRPDGSASLREEVTLSGMGLMALAAEAEDGGDPWSDLDLEARATALGEGVRLASFEPAEDGFASVYEVDDVRTLAFSMEDGFGSGEMPTGLSYRFLFADATADGPATLRVIVPKLDRGKPRPPAADLESHEGGEAAQALAMLRGVVGDARMTVAVEVEGEITETTASFAEASRVTLFDLPFGPFLDAMAENPAWAADGPPDPAAFLSELNGVEGVRVERPGTVRVRFR